MSHGNEMICQPVTLSGYAEWPKVADAVIEAHAIILENDRDQRWRPGSMLAPSTQTGPTDCLHQCGNKRLCRLGVTPSISTLGSQMSEAPFCLYAACLLIEILHTGHSRLIPHQWKGCLGPVWSTRSTRMPSEVMV